MHSYARSAAAASLVAHEMGKFWEFHKALYKNSRWLSDEKVQEIATDLGLDPDLFLEEMASKRIQHKIEKDIIEAEKAGATGTPTIFINGRRLRNRSSQGFQEIINAQLKKLK